MRTALAASLAVACLLAPTAAPPAVAADPAAGVQASRATSVTPVTQGARGDQPRCLKSADKVATKKLRSRGGGYLGRLVITVSTRQQGAYDHVVCAYTEVAKKHRSRQHVVRQTFIHLGSDGARLGEVRGDTYASKRKPLLFGSSFDPAGHSYVFRATLETGTKSSGKVRYRVPG